MEFHMRSTLYLRGLAGALLCGALLAPAFAVPVMDMRAEDFLPMAADLKQQLKLNANQQTLWQQTESRTRNLLRERKARRERLQAAAQAAAQTPGVELREVSRAVDAEAETSIGEEKLLREWWLTMNDALDETQRGMVAQQVNEHLLRVQDNGGPGRGERREEGGDHRGGGGRKGGGQGGMGGMGVGVGAGGASINLPGG
jgi:hypothetical protein